MFWLLIYRVVSLIIFVLGLPLVTIICLLVPKWREGLDQKLGLIDYETIKQIRASHFTDILSKLKDKESEKAALNQHLDKLEGAKQKNIWLHAVSFGEVKTIEPLVYKLQEAFPEYHLCLSTGTKTGQELAKKLFSNHSSNPRLKKEIYVFYKPFDFYFAVKNWLDSIRPSFLIIAETEIWPELLFQSYKRKIPAFLVNARLTEKSAKGYKALLPLWQQVLKSFKVIFAQTSLEKNLFQSIGAQESQIQVLGNLKFDSMQRAPKSLLEELKRELALNDESTVFVAGSTHRSEEELVCIAFKESLQKYPNKNLRLILAPRHPERLSEVYDLLKKMQINFAKRSDYKNSANNSSKDWQVLVLDTLGELNKFYGLGDFAFLGGTWADVGGHNPLEPASYGLQTLLGPKSYKIQDLVRQLKEAGLVIEFDSQATFEKEFETLLDSVLPLSREEKERAKQRRIAAFVPQTNLSVQTIEIIKENLNAQKNV